MTVKYVSTINETLKDVITNTLQYLGTCFYKIGKQSKKMNFDLAALKDYEKYPSYKG